MACKLIPHLMFEGAAEQALTLYVALFPNSAVRQIERYGAEGPGRAGTIKWAVATVAGQELMAIDSPIKHDFTFTPAMSLFVDCESEAELDAAYARLVDGGAVLMPPGNYGFSTKFTWVKDRFGVSWQLNFGALTS